MSDNWILFIPSDPEFKPSSSVAEQARSLLASFVPETEEVLVLFQSSVTFFDPGSNWSGVECPACGADAEPWWKESMDVAAQNNFKNLIVTTPCCRVRVSLNDLRYVWSAAFGSFVLEAMNPNICDLSLEQESKLQEVVGHKLRKVWIHL
jgi:hypothetical protein